MTAEEWDAAEFEARVAEKLAGGEAFCPPQVKVHRWEDNSKCIWDIVDSPKGKEVTHETALQYCKWCSLKSARLAVEAEMEAENDV